MEHKITVDKSKLNHYKLKITALSPVHIGTGEVYEPTSFVIDDGKLFAFDEVLFYQSLGRLDKVSFDTKLGNWMQIINFYKDHIESAKKIASFECDVTDKVADRYKAKKNRDGSINYNQLQINTTFKNPNTYRAVIPGSSIKGMLDTVLKIYPQKIKDNDARQNLIVGDALLLDGGVEIGYSYRRHKNPTKVSRSDIPQMVEVIRKGSSFVFDLSTVHSFEILKKSMKRYHEERHDTLYEEDAVSFVARIGKYSGKEYMVDDGTNVLNSYDKPIATHTIFEKGDTPFGWVRVELLSDEAFRDALKDIEKQEAEYYAHLESRQQEIKARIQEARDEAKAAAQKKEAERLAQEKAEADARAKKEARLSTMSPLEREIEKLYEAHPNPNDTIDVVLYAAIRDGKFDSSKCEALQILKEKMVELKKWVESSKKPQKDKKYKRTIEIMGLLEGCD
jgi:FKBP-type peptidyl-prolyl cis-trans isomerase